MRVWLSNVHSFLTSWCSPHLTLKENAQTESEIIFFSGSQSTLLLLRLFALILSTASSSCVCRELRETDTRGEGQIQISMEAWTVDVAPQWVTRKSSMMLEGIIVMIWVPQKLTLMQEFWKSHLLGSETGMERLSGVCYPCSGHCGSLELHPTGNSGKHRGPSAVTPQGWGAQVFTHNSFQGEVNTQALMGTRKGKTPFLQH